VAGGPRVQVVTQIVGDHAGVLVGQYDPLFDRQKQLAPLLPATFGVHREGFHAQRGGAAPGLGQDGVLVVAAFGKQAARRGFIRGSDLADTSEAEWDAVIRVHLKGHFTMLRHAAQYWRGQTKLGAAVDARIINTSSAGGLQGSVGQGNYSAAKAGIAALTLVAAAELGRYGVTVNAIAPSARTRMTEAVFTEMTARPDNGFDPMAPENISPLVVWLGSDKSRDITGRVFEIEGGLIRVAEGWAHGPQTDKGARWDPAELGPVVTDLLAKSRPPIPVYRP